MITEIRRGMNVKRFHTTVRLQEETIGHHSANVAAIILRLDPLCSRDLLVAALMHDIAEAYTGDVPAPFKWDYPDIAKGLKEGERSYVRDQYIPNPTLTDAEALLLKLADMLDLVLSSIEEWRKGNAYARVLTNNGIGYLRDMDNYALYEDAINAMIEEVKNEGK